MRALVYYRSIPRYLLAQGLNRLWPRHFFSRVAPLKLQAVPPPARRPGWVLLRPRLCGICGSDLRLLKGVESLLLEPYASFPAILGHEVVGEVVEAPLDSGWRPGERAVVEPVLSCALRGLDPCPFCAQGLYNLCENFLQGDLAPGVVLGYNRDVGGGMAEMMAAHPSRMLRVPEGVPDDAAVLTDSLASALQPLLDNFPEDSETVVIFGAGIIGQHLIRALRALGSAARVVMVARYPFQVELAREGGADLVLNSPSRAELGEAVGACLIPTTLGGGNLEGGAHLFLDCVGSRRSLQEGLLSLRGRGRYVLVGTAGSLGPVDISSLWFRELRVTGSSMYAHSRFRGRTVRTYEQALALLAGGKFSTRGLISHTYPLAAYRQAIQAAFDKRRHQSVKVVLDLR